jgi:hypothetical protein
VKKNNFLIITILLFISCGKELNNRVYETEGAGYGAAEGRFIVAFPK